MPWSREDVAFLRSNYKTKTASEIAAALNKTEHAVNGKKHRLRFVRESAPGERVNFTVSCLSCKEEYYPLVSQWIHSPGRGWCRKCAAEKDRLRNRAKNRGREVEARRAWLPEEDAQLEVGALELPGRTYTAIMLRRRALGIKKRPQQSFSESELAFIRRNAGKLNRAEIAEELGRPIDSVSAKMQRMGYRDEGPRLRRKHHLTERQRERVPKLVADAIKHLRDKPHIREEVTASLALDVLDGKIPVNGIKDAVQAYRTKAYAMFPEKGAHASLDTKVFDDGPTTLGIPSRARHSGSRRGNVYLLDEDRRGVPREQMGTRERLHGL